MLENFDDPFTQLFTLRHSKFVDVVLIVYELSINIQACWNDTNCKNCLIALLNTTDGLAYFGGNDSDGRPSVGYNSIPSSEIKKRQKAFFYTLNRCVSRLRK